MAATSASSIEERGQIRPQARGRAAVLAESFVPAITFLWGRREKKIPEGTWEFIGTYRGLFEVSTIMYSNERKRFPEELFLPGFPAHDNLAPGTKDSSIPHPTPAPGLTAASSFLNSIPIIFLALPLFPPYPSYPAV